MAVRARVVGLLLLVPALGRSQPPLPPTERPKTVGTVAGVQGAEAIALTSGFSAPLSPGLKLTGTATLGDLTPGDVVELAQDANGRVTDLIVLPRLVQRKPLLEVLSGNPAVPRFWWNHGGRDYPDSLYAAAASLPLRQRCVVFEATAAHVAPATAPPVSFAVIGDDGAPLWEKSLAPGETAVVRCALGKAPKVELRCRHADGTSPDASSCVWGSPTVVLQEPGMVALGPQAGTDLAQALAAALKSVPPGKIAVARPTVIGLSPELVRDLQEDLFTSVGRRWPVAGMLSVDTGPALTDGARAAAKSQGAASVLTCELRYAPEALHAQLALVDVAGNEVLAQARTSLKP